MALRVPSLLRRRVAALNTRGIQIRQISGEDSHADFIPKRKAPSSREFDPSPIQENKVMLYMKGTPSFPQCGFSAQVVRVLHAEGAKFASVNVLADPVVREGIKRYSNWPTIPQLYVKGEFIGGCDIVTSMFETGELTDLLREAGALVGGEGGEASA